MSEIILHHYDLSPFAHKARLMLGHKDLSWRSVDIPLVMPKPDLMPLTGGFRRTPVMQIGADVFCDTARIAVELERRHPDPTLYPAGGEGLATIMTKWADDNLFRPGVNFVFAHIADKLPPDLLGDRAKMRGAEPPDVDQFMAMAPRFAADIAPLLHTVDSLFEDGRPFISGDRPGLADYAVYHPIWMFRGGGKKVAAALEPFANLQAWMARVEAVGTGSPTDLSATEALDIAKAADPAPLPGDPRPDAASPQPGDTVSIISADKVPEAVVGEVVYVAENEVTIRRQDDRVGTIHQHYPRAGYLIKKV